MIYCIGDSHASVFSGNENIIPCYPEKYEQKLNGFMGFRIGAPTAYNFFDNRMAEIYGILNILKPKPEDFVMICAGEIDCRCHLVKQHKIQGRLQSDIVNECVDSYIRVHKSLKSSGYRACAWNAVVPSTYSYPEQPEDCWSHVGSFEERNAVAIMFNKRLSEACLENGVYFISIYEKLLESLNPHNGTNQTSVYYRDEIHLNQNAIPLILDAVEYLTGGLS